MKRQKSLSKKAALFLAIATILSVFSTGAFAADDVVWLSENYSWTSDNTFQAGLMQVHTVGQQEGYISGDTKYGFINVTGKIVVPLVYDYCFAFSEGLAAVGKVEKYGFIDNTGKEVIPLIYDYCGNFRDGLAMVRKGEDYGYKYGFIDKTGKEVIPAIYKHVSNFADGIAAFTNESDEIGFIDENGKLLIQTQYKDYMGDDIQQFNEGLCPVSVYSPELKESKYGFIDTTGKMVINAIYNDYGMVINPYRFNGGVSMVFLPDEDSNVQYIDKTGKFVEKPKETLEGISPSFKSDKYGAVDQTGKQVIPFVYSYLSSFTDGIAVASKDANLGVIDQSGKQILPFVYDNISTVYERTIFVRKDGKVGTIKNMTASKPVVTMSATPTSSKVMVNGKDVTFEAYSINGYNYFKLRDLAMAVKGSDKEFEVTWDGTKNAINLISNKSYTAVGGELEISKNPSAKIPAASTSKIFVHASEASLMAYTIDGNNYFKLRDVLKVFDIGVAWDGAKNTISIDTSTGYTD